MTATVAESRPLRIGIAWDDAVRGVGAGFAPDGTARGDLRIVVAAVERAVLRAGHDAVRLPLDFPLSPHLETLERGGFDLVLNLVEGMGDVATGEIGFAALLDLACVPYTGADPMALALALDKARAKAVLAQAGVPTPSYAVVRPGSSLPNRPLRYPLIVKPALEDGSLGIEDDAVVGDETALRSRIEWVHTHFVQPALVEEFVDGREFNVSVLGDGTDRFALPVAEIDFAGLPAGRPRIVSFNAKWREDTVEYSGTVPVIPAPLPPDVAERLRAVALTAAAAIGVRDYARVDLRLDPQGRPWVLEVNPNPDLSPDAGLPRAAKVHGWDYDTLILRLVELARKRPPRPRRSVRSLETTVNP